MHRRALVLLVAFACRDRQALVRTPFSAADSLRVEGRFKEALPHYRRLRDSFALAGDSASLWRAQLWWSEALLRGGRLDSAEAALEQELALARGDQSREGWTRHVRSLLLHRQGRLDSALVEAGRSLALARAVHDRELEARGRSVLGTVHSLSGRYESAAAEMEQSVVLERELRGPPQRLATQLNNVAVEYRHLGRLEDAERALQEGLAIARDLTSPRTAMLLHGNLSRVRRMGGDNEGAAQLMEESLREAQSLGDAQFIALAQAELGALYLHAGSLARARGHLEAALVATREGGNAYNQLFVLEQLGRLELEQGRHDRALQTLARARLLADSTGFGKQRADVRAALTRAALAGRDLRAARRWADEAVRIADSVGDIESRFEALQARAAVREAAGEERGAGAAASYLEAIGLLESWRGRLTLGDLRMGVGESKLGAYEGAIRVLLARDQPAAAFEVAERARARMLLELLAERDVSRPGVEKGGRRDSLRRELRIRHQALTEARAPDRTTLNREIAMLTARLAVLEAEEQRRDPAAALRYPAPASVAQVRAGLLAGDRGGAGAGAGAGAVLAYFWGDGAVYGWWIGASGVRAARLGSADSLAALVAFLRGAIERPSAIDWRPAAHRAFRVFVAPLAPSGAEELLVVPDGPLTHLPIEIFLPAPDAAPLAVTRRIIYGPSASVLLALATSHRATTWGAPLLAVGNPALEPERRAVLLGPLPYAAQEARAIHGMFRGPGADVLVGREATLERWLALDPARYRYLHFAAHALVSDVRPERTRLMLRGGSLDLAAIRRLRLSAELVTLSACETALGRRVRGEGVIGLPHAFLAAGARGTVVTLWRVADRSAADFMEAFYRELSAGHSASEALRRIRQVRIAGGGAAHPSQWAAFILVGGAS